jgi:lipid-A-disaccharide synthase-like uncharacterized protein
MIEHWREILYPIGFLSAFAFTARFVVQWISSEMKQKSMVTTIFWKLSLLGNTLLLIHSIIQSQFHIAFVQTCNGVISWRNLNLMQPASKQYSLFTTISVLLSALCCTFFIFLGIDFFFNEGSFDWFRIPVWRWQTVDDVPFLWHLIGFGGLILFNSRFWVQWWLAEKHKTSYLGPTFWWMSLIGDLFCLAYFLSIKDPVNIVGAAFGFIPYLRNLMLIYKSRKSSIVDTSS